MSDVHIRLAEAADVPALCALIFEHGPNPWNYLPEAQVRAHLQCIGAGEVEAVLAEHEGATVGFVSFMPSTAFARYQPADRCVATHGYICEAVVHRAMAGRGLGTQLLDRAVARLAERGLTDIYIDRHEENRASAGMMRKAGFVEVETYLDPQRRSEGSRRTAVCYRQL